MQVATGLVQVSCAAGDRAEADRIATALVEARLAACVHLTPIESIYRWQGAVQRDAEVLLQIKTTADRLPDVEAAIRRLHGYALPEITATAIGHGSAEYLAWVAESVAPAPG